MWPFALSMGAFAAAVATECPLNETVGHVSGFVTYPSYRHGWDLNGEYTFSGFHHGKPMFHFGRFVIAYQYRWRKYILSDNAISRNAAYCRCDRPGSADNVLECAPYWHCVDWLGEGSIEVSCAANPTSAHSAARWRSAGLMVEPPEPQLLEQEEEEAEMSEMTCGKTRRFPFADNGADRFVRFRLDKTCDVTVSNCDTTFDTTLKMWSEDESEELSQTQGHCDGDDCFCSARAGNAYNEQFSIDALPAGTYVLQIGLTHLYPAYETGASIGQYVLSIECSECSDNDSSALLGVHVSLRALVVAVALITCVAMALIARRRTADGYAKVQVLAHSEADESLEVHVAA